MQINIDKKTGILLGTILVLVLAVVSLASQNNNNFMGMDRGQVRNTERGMMDGSSNSKYTGADVMFLQMMIPHHQQAIDISNLALKTSKDAELLALAKDIIKAQSAEIIQMKAWLKDAGASTELDHSMGHGMGGMLSDSELSTLQAATGPAFDLLWLKGMINHHDGAIHMTTMIDEADNAEIKAFGEKIVIDQSAQIKQMKAMQKRINK